MEGSYLYLCEPLSILKRKLNTVSFRRGVSSRSLHRLFSSSLSF
jgi:hypothetical protein